MGESSETSSRIGSVPAVIAVVAAMVFFLWDFLRRVPARITETPEPVQVTEGDAIHLVVAIEGTPFPKVQWSKQGRIILDDDRHNFVEGAEHVILTIPESELTDTATYTLRVSNKDATDSCTIDVVVSEQESPDDQPTPPKTPDDKPVPPSTPDDKPTQPETPEDKPAPPKIPEDKPDPPKIPDDKPDPPKIPEDKPPPPKIPEEKPDPPKIPEDKPPPPKVPEDKPPPPKVPDDKPPPPKIPDDKPTPPPVLPDTPSGTKTKEVPPERTEELFKKFQTETIDEIGKSVKTPAEVTEVIKKAGLKDCNLIFGLDYTNSNLSQGFNTFKGRCLHAILHGVLNPYQTAICTLGKTLKTFLDDGGISAFGFGESRTKDHSVFSLKPGGKLPNFQEVLRAYNKVTPTVKLDMPTSFAPVINKAIEIVEFTNKFHILVIVCDGQYFKKEPTTRAIIRAAYYPLSIIMVGVGDGPWSLMRAYARNLPEETNFHFVEYAKVTQGTNCPNASFAMHALHEVPEHYKRVMEKKETLI